MVGRTAGFRHSEETKAKIRASIAAKRTNAAPQGPDTASVRADERAGTPVVAASSDPLDALAQGDPKQIIALMLWKARHQEPELAVQISAQDLKGYLDCVSYLGIQPEVRIVRPQGDPGHPEIPATRNHGVIPSKPPSPPRDYVAVNLVQRGTNDGFKPIENNETDFVKAEQAKQAKRFREIAPQLAGQLQNDAATGNFNSSILIEAAQALLALAK